MPVYFLGKTPEQSFEQRYFSATNKIVFIQLNRL